jgi:hypothetical protein
MEDREVKGRTLMDAYKQVMSDFTNLFEAQRKESLKRDSRFAFRCRRLKAASIPESKGPSRPIGKMRKPGAASCSAAGR